MKPPAIHPKLKQFQDHGDVESLKNYLTLTHKNILPYEAVIKSLAPVFESLQIQIQFNVEGIDLETLQKNKNEASDILKLMHNSGKADMKYAALKLMAILAWQEFKENFQRSLSTTLKWEYELAFDALTYIKAPLATILLNDKNCVLDANIIKKINQAE